MRRLTQGLIAGGLVATAAGMVMKKRRNNNMMNNMMNTMINMMGRLGAFRMMSKTRFFRNMVRSR